MDEIKKLLSEIISGTDFSRERLQQLKHSLNDIAIDNKKKQILQGHLVNEAAIALQADKNCLKWLLNAYVVLENADKNTISTEVYFSPGDDCRNAIVEKLRNAIHSIQICVFTISDDLISSEIINCKKRGLKVQVITDNDKSLDLGSDVERLASEGVSVKMDTSPSHMHHKFAIIDDEYLISGSYNWTRSAYTQNQENIFVSNSEMAIMLYQKEFNRLWELF